ncbi:hypothetical protein ACPCW1_17260 [Bacillus pumilus]
MIDLKNPYSRNRLSLKERFNKRFTDFSIPFIKKISLDEDWKAKSKYIPKVLESARINIRAMERGKSSTTEMPQGVDLDLLSVYVAEYIPIENIDTLNKGLKKLIEDYPSKFQHGQAERIDEFCTQVKKSIRGGRWSNFGSINFTKGEKITEFVEKVHIHGTHLSSSSIILQFVIKPSDTFLSEFKKIIEIDITGEFSFNLSLKRIFKSWGGKSLSDDIIKNQKLEDLIIELKWRTMNEISKYFPLFFTNNVLIPPSIEVYKLNQTSSVFRQNEDEKRSLFWRSLGMDSLFKDISKDGYWQLFYDGSEPYNIDSSLKITCNSLIKRKQTYYSLEFQIVHMLEEFANLILPTMVMKEYTEATSRKLAIQQSNTFSSIQKEKPKYHKLINIRYELERNLQILKRFKNEIGDNYFNRVKAKVNKIAEFEPSYPQYTRNKSTTEMIIDNTKYSIDKTSEHSQNFAKMIDDTVQLLEIKTNNSLRKRSFGLSIITVILSVPATAFAGLSLFYQLSDEKRQKIVNLFSPIVDLWRQFF